MNKIWAIIVNFQEDKNTLRCVECLQKQSQKLAGIVIVDNLTKGDLVKTLKRKQLIKVIPVKNNIGFSRGVNLGIKYSLLQKATHVLLINPDTEINKDALKKLINNKKAGIVSPLIFYKRGERKIYDFGGYINWRWGRVKHIESESVQAQLSRESDFYSGCCLLIKKNVINEVGLFDERFFLYYEDVDYFVRAKEKGILFQQDKSVLLKHELKGHGFEERIPYSNIYHNLRSNLLFILKYQKKQNLLLSLIYWLALFVKVLLNELFS